MLKLRESGDTIVEVLIVLAVLGLAISISYATANRSLLNTRQAQENAEATRLLQTQLERLRILAANGPTETDATRNAYTYDKKFCITASGATLTRNDGAAAACKGLNTYYDVSILYCPGDTTSDPGCAGITANDGTFLLRASWDNVRGEGRDSVTYVYRYFGKWD